MVRRRSLLAAAASAAGVVLAACAAAPPAAESPFTPAQVAAMKDLGFQQTDEGWQLDLGARVLFEFGSDALNPSATAAIDRLATTLLGVGVDRCRIEGHADEIGAGDYNVALSLRRADAVARVMQSRGMPAGRLSTRGFGKAKPVGDNRTEAGRAQNRRVVVIVPAA
jgi:outer membrane protein OmpA-like peptidoglycan-associated protein